MNFNEIFEKCNLGEGNLIFCCLDMTNPNFQ